MSKLRDFLTVFFFYRKPHGARYALKVAYQVAYKGSDF